MAGIAAAKIVEVGLLGPGETLALQLALQEPNLVADGVQGRVDEDALLDDPLGQVGPVAVRPVTVGVDGVDDRVDPGVKGVSEAVRGRAVRDDVPSELVDLVGYRGQLLEGEGGVEAQGCARAAAGRGDLYEVRPPP